MNGQRRASLQKEFPNSFNHLFGGFPKMGKPHVTKALVLALILFTTSIAGRPASALSRDQVATDLRSTVQVIVPDDDFGIFSLGSGTAMNESGLILTNNH